jgi:hypothetical protein
MEKEIIYCGQKHKVCCDQRCNKAWGMNSRPRVYAELGEKVFGMGFGGGHIYPDNFDEMKDIDDYTYLADHELGKAPKDPGTYEGGYAKPIIKSERMNKWCTRECERCVMSDPGKFNEPLRFKDFSKRFHNVMTKNI